MTTRSTLTVACMAAVVLSVTVLASRPEIGIPICAVAVIVSLVLLAYDLRDALSSARQDGADLARRQPCAACELMRSELDTLRESWRHDRRTFGDALRERGEA